MDNSAQPDAQDGNPFWGHSPANKPGPKTWLTDRRREAVRELRDYGMVPAAIADSLGMSDRTVRRYLREAGVPE
jgi:DNA invertase Pin-like site-specific DNA recombinase